jgi:hypothetical protein
MAEGLVWDREKGEIRIMGRRDTAVNAQALCDYLDTLVGVQVAEVITKNLEFRLGKEDGASIRAERPKATTDDFVKLLAEWDRMAGMGVTKVTLTEERDAPILVEVSNPSVKGNVGSSKAFLFSWWAGALTSVLGRELETRNVTYDKERNIMKGEVIARLSE